MGETFCDAARIALGLLALLLVGITIVRATRLIVCRYEQQVEEVDWQRRNDELMAYYDMESKGEQPFIPPDHNYHTASFDGEGKIKEPK